MRLAAPWSPQRQGHRLYSGTNARYGGITYDAHGQPTTIGAQSLVSKPPTATSAPWSGPAAGLRQRDAIDPITSRREGWSHHPLRRLG
ncbi:MAG TPA: hypothetical protein VK988_05050 [Acidimicrobiales bacterium]|nr:hypothetical protein [Acidimicrobiales bacterium]